MIVTLTGHRTIADPGTLQVEIRHILWGCLQKDTDLSVRCGMAPGADLLFANVAMEMGIPILPFIPDPFYYKRYVAGDKIWENLWMQVLKQEPPIHYSSGSSDWRNNFKRNDEMMTGVNRVLAAYHYDDIDLYTRSYRPRKGGTAHGIQSAIKHGHKLGATLIHIPV